jgi:hypothetical protein
MCLELASSGARPAWLTWLGLVPLGSAAGSAVGALAAARRFSHESGALSAQIKTKPSARHARGAGALFRFRSSRLSAFAALPLRFGFPFSRARDLRSRVAFYFAKAVWPIAMRGVKW